ncbi:hypothetical protein [Litorimonas haliclonae]|uniref:hypothetical protein n=1 Tax=Litorimonas haliclonae TaxID=2081977 RepID=UPI0039F019EF
MTYQTHRLIWQGIEIEARYDPQYCESIVAHLEIQAIKPERTRLPVTETGYRSHFHNIGMIERDYGGDVIACVEDWLDEASKDKSWQDYVEASRQGSLF